MQEIATLSTISYDGGWKEGGHSEGGDGGATADGMVMVMAVMVAYKSGPAY